MVRRDVGFEISWRRRRVFVFDSETNEPRTADSVRVHFALIAGPSHHHQSTILLGNCPAISLESWPHSETDFRLFSSWAIDDLSGRRLTQDPQTNLGDCIKPLATPTLKTLSSVRRFTSVCMIRVMKGLSYCYPKLER